jgi:hypothetical protein
MSFLPLNTILGQLRIIEVLDWYDGPRLFIAQNRSGSRYIVFWADETEEGSLWLYASASENRIDGIVSGKLDLRRIYTEPEEGMIFLIRLFKDKPSSVEMVFHHDIDQELLPPVDDFLIFEDRESFSENDILDLVESNPHLIHEINISKPRSNAIVAFESLSSVAAIWSKLIHCALDAPPVLVGVRVGSLIAELQTESGDKLPKFFNKLQMLVKSPTHEHIEANLSRQECKLLEMFLELLHKEKLTLSTKIISTPDNSLLVLSHFVVHDLRLVLIDFNQQTVESAEVPQADNLDKLFRMIELMNDGVADLGILLGLSPRQVNYYKHAALVLDLLNENYSITSRGQYLLTLPQVKDRYKVVMLLFESSPIGFAWLRYCKKQSVLDIDPDSAGAFLESRSSNLSINTIGRRARTLRAWVIIFQTQ